MRRSRRRRRMMRAGRPTSLGWIFLGSSMQALDTRMGRVVSAHHPIAGNAEFREGGGGRDLVFAVCGF
jgi:hypothetical protein